MATTLIEDAATVNGDVALAASIRNDSTTENDVEVAQSKESPDVVDELDWDNSPHNPFNWPARKKALQVVMLSSAAFLASIGTSIMSSARGQLMTEFNVSSTVALLPLTMYVLALGFGPVIGGPLSETIGRYTIYAASVPLGAFFTIGAGFVHNMGGLCFLRFMAGLCWGPVLAVAPGTLSETFTPKNRGPVSAVFILMPFLGPGLGPVIGSFVVNRKGWRWTQWTLIFFAIFAMIVTAFSEETFHPAIKRKLAKKMGLKVDPSPPLSARLKAFAVVALVRPVRMLLFEPITGFICLYVSAEFGTLFSFFAAVPYTFGRVYQFSIEESGLVFLSIVIGCILGLITVILCDVFLYRTKAHKYPPHQIPPEHRLYPAMIGSIGLPIGLFWFAWTARPGVSWASPAAAMIVFAWGNLCVFVSTIQYTTDTYHGSVVASAASANSLARYGFAGVFPLFTIQMYQKLGIDWASSLLAFIALALLPVPWVLFKYGPRIRAKSEYETVQFT
ncbi:MFS domain-containing protein [Fusarium keratoplasticum]|uniref:MFS domain-containing protein n=1 Tax=Fusarium keratoplasticum TaxID=1328300 RepID=A0ACC0QJ38_9HYPO|nr:MFS domain-containing protein [Fusarium keratoplasticum]KAI8654823.1 MFS domain-containing protein [Fusarium keratoplasticum]KAI8655669.1 MFS domain-containing protein [Fusarium keratoplasticum]